MCLSDIHESNMTYKWVIKSSHSFTSIFMTYNCTKSYHFGFWPCTWIYDNNNHIDHYLWCIYRACWGRRRARTSWSRSRVRDWKAAPRRATTDSTTARRTAARRQTTQCPRGPPLLTSRAYPVPNTISCFTTPTPRSPIYSPGIRPSSQVSSSDYSNRYVSKTSCSHDVNAHCVPAPEPPTNLTVTLGRNKQATIAWSPPAHGDYTGFRFKVIPLTERAEGGARNISVEGAGNWTYTLRDLSPGATYQLHAFTLLHDKESAAYASRNFTTSQYPYSWFQFRHSGLRKSVYIHT